MQSFRPAWQDDGKDYGVSKCPKCGYPQFCGCPSCKDKIPQGIFPYKWRYEFIDKDHPSMELMQCANCGFDASPDWWMDEEVRQYEKKTGKKIFY